jgi:hypothetical protein
VVQENLIANFQPGNKTECMTRIATLVLLFQTLSAFAAQLDLAVVQFPEVKTLEQLNAALTGVSLAEITNADRTVTSAPYLQGARVLFAQSLPSTAQISSSTRLGNTRADVTGQLKNNSLEVEIRLTEGVDSGLRRFTSRTHAGSAPLPTGAPRVIAMRIITGKTKSVTKGSAEVKESVSCHVVLAQLR